MYIAYWFDYYPGDSTGLAAAYQEFAAMDPATAYAPELVDALLEKLAPEATALARQGDVAGAAAALREQLDPYPGLEIDVEAAADRISQDASTGSLPVEGAPSTAAATGAGDTFGATPLALGDTVVGTIAPNTADTWIFTGNAGATITIDLAANGSDLDPYLFLLGPDGATIGENDDFSGSEARIEMSLPEDGTYTILAMGYQDSSGDYTLTLTGGPQP